ncbi:hypothetical protein GCM10009530_63260 [Microbispora corallina]|uniref:Secreted protein n=1 Tax=Microbispora corallina TaxID=83302 RepID=A0ABQ4GBH1_9ACTN|nr:hypothetical protein [Microbispora corallina]GIH44444.1 hypothetical protein Mco01_74440 [Microbispora corallina]
MLTQILLIAGALVAGGIIGAFAMAICAARTVDNLVGQRDALANQLARRDEALRAATGKGGAQ